MLGGTSHCSHRHQCMYHFGQQHLINALNVKNLCADDNKIMSCNFTYIHTQFISEITQKPSNSMFYYYIGSITDYSFLIPNVKKTALYIILGCFNIFFCCCFFLQVCSAAALNICIKFSNVHGPQADRTASLVEILVLIG